MFNIFNCRDFDSEVYIAVCVTLSHSKSVLIYDLNTTWFSREQEITLNLSASRPSFITKKKNPYYGTSLYQSVKFMFEIKSKLWPTGKIKSSIYNISEIITNYYKYPFIKKRLYKSLKDAPRLGSGFCQLLENLFLGSANVALVYLQKITFISKSEKVYLESFQQLQ